MQNKSLIWRIGVAGLALTLEALIGGGCSYSGRNRQESNVEAKLYNFETLNEIYRGIDAAEGYTDENKAMIKFWYKDLMGGEFTREERGLIRKFDEFYNSPRGEEFKKELLTSHPYINLERITEIDKVVVMRTIQVVKRKIQCAVGNVNLSTLTEDEKRFLKSPAYSEEEKRIIEYYGMEPDNLSDKGRIFWYRLRKEIYPAILCFTLK